MRILPEKKRVLEIPVEQIAPNPAQPRREFAEGALDELAESIRENGLLQPVTVRRVPGGYELVAGERRLRACKKAGLATVPCLVQDCDGRQSAVLSMLENIQREDLQLFEEAEGLQRLIGEWGVTQEEAARRLGKSQPALANKLRLLRLTAEEREAVTRAGLTERHARAALRLPEPMRLPALREIIRKGYNVQQAEAYVESLLASGGERKAKPRAKGIVKDVRIFLNTVQHAVDTMKRSGIAAVARKNETDEYIECTILIPKF